MKYQLIKEEYLKEIKTNARLYRHIKSGARILTLANDDKNKTFTIGFRTPPVNNTGVPHILEHSTLSGSKKFPVKDPFVELLKGSLNTFLNAITFADKTLYPVASCNLKDFKNLMEVYLDAVFYPNVYIHEEIFKQEGWHYELENKEDDIKINGVVYNEMKGAFSSAEETVFRKISNSLFPDTTYGVESGGDPKYIPDLTYKEFLDFHRKYYSPSNSYIVLYGDMDMDERMDYMDKAYLSKFNKVDVDSCIHYQKPFDKMSTYRFDYPVSKDSNLENQTYYAYNVVVGDYKDVKLSHAFGILSYVLLDIPGAPLRQALLDSKICKDVMTSYEDDILQPTYSIVAKDAVEGKEAEFINIINTTLQKISKEGLDKKAILSAINRNEFVFREAEFVGAPKGLLYTIELLSSWLYDETDFFGRMKALEIYSDLRKKLNEGYFESLIDKYLLSNNHSSLVIASPNNELLEKEEIALKEKLKAYKESLSDEEILKLIESTKKQREYSATPSTKKELSSLPKLKREDIEKETEKLINSCLDINEVKSIEHNIETNGIAYLRIQFDASNIKQDYVKYLGILSTLLSQVDTKHYTYNELGKEINLNTGGLQISLNAYTNNDVHPYISFAIKYFYGKEKEIFKYLTEIIMYSKYTDKTRIMELLQEAESSLSMYFMRGGNQVSTYRALSYINKYYYYQENFSGIEQYNLLNEILDDYDNKYDQLVSIIKKLQKQLFRKENLIISYTGLEYKYRDYIESFSNSLYKNDVKKYVHKFKKNIKNEAFKTPGQVQYVSQVGLYDASKYNGHMLAFNQILSYEYLWVKVRVIGGAYGARNTILRNGTITFSSYRDPNLKETLDVYNDIPSFISTLKFSEKDLTQYIIGAIGRLDRPMPPKERGDYSFMCYLSGISDEDEMRVREELITTTMKDIKALKPIYKKALKQNIYCVIGNENKIDSNKELFKEVKNLL
ncbi:insulinase family protein [bacterium]|nr:insulinase family protein [bacterium]